jgi:hypothetical protein
MEQGSTETEARREPRAWPRALALFGVVLITSVFVHPGVVIGVPLALLLAARGFGNLLATTVVALVILIVAGGRDGPADGLWYAERAWAVLLGGWFLALTLLAPAWRLTSRALAAAAGAGAVVAGIFAVRAGSWGALDGAVGRSMQSEIQTTMDAISILGGGEALTSEMLETAQAVAEAQMSVFPALLGIESLAALAVAWWARSRLLGERDPGLAPLRDFRFNDHLVWVLVAGLVLLLTQSGAAWARVGSNAVFFMGALYALRGAAVYLFVSGGLSIFGSVILVMLMAFVPTVILGTAALIGIGDTWLDLRGRIAEKAV